MALAYLTLAPLTFVPLTLAPLTLVPLTLGAPAHLQHDGVDVLFDDTHEIELDYRSRYTL